jgi:hypothetical protein
MAAAYTGPWEAPEPPVEGQPERPPDGRHLLILGEKKTYHMLARLSLGTDLHWALKSTRSSARGL